MLNNGLGYNPICCKSKPFHTTYMVCDDQIQVQLFHQLLDKILYGVVNTEYLKIKARMLMLLNLKIKHICHSDQIQFKTMHWNAYWFDITQIFWKIALEKTLVNFQAFLRIEWRQNYPRQRFKSSAYLCPKVHGVADLAKKNSKW